MIKLSYVILIVRSSGIESHTTKSVNKALKGINTLIIKITSNQYQYQC